GPAPSGGQAPELHAGPPDLSRGALGRPRHEGRDAERRPAPAEARARPVPGAGVGGLEGRDQPGRPLPQDHRAQAGLSVGQKPAPGILRAVVTSRGAEAPMGLMQRFNMIFKAKASKMLDRAEDPRETLDYSYEKQLEMLQKVRRGVADVATSKKRLELQSA